jgi:hypothetical protein
VSAMGERFLILEATADAIEVIDPGLARKFRVINGLPSEPREDEAEELTPTELRGSKDPARDHEIRMDVVDRRIHCECTCEGWSSAFDSDEIDTMVVQIRAHLGTDHASSEDGIKVTPTSVSPRRSEKRAG